MVWDTDPRVRYRDDDSERSEQASARDHATDRILPSSECRHERPTGTCKPTVNPMNPVARANEPHELIEMQTHGCLRMSFVFLDRLGRRVSQYRSCIFLQRSFSFIWRSRNKYFSDGSLSLSFSLS